MKSGASLFMEQSSLWQLNTGGLAYTSHTLGATFTTRELRENQYTLFFSPNEGLNTKCPAMCPPSAGFPWLQYALQKHGSPQGTHINEREQHYCKKLAKGCS